MSKPQKKKTAYECQACGARFPKWMGKCGDCGGWNSIVEVVVETDKEKGRAWAGSVTPPVRLSEVEGGEEPRFSTTIDELDRALGGGIVEGSAVLVGGDPGIGKSTLLLQLLMGMAAGGKTVLYLSGEESVRQIRLRCDRLGGPSGELLVQTEIDIDRILETLKATKPLVAVVDSVQTLYSSEISGAPGTVGQVRESASRLVAWAKNEGTPVFLVGHVTKDGSIAGPRVLEHMVDTVLYFEGDKGHPFRILRAVKNRFGSTNEVGVFEMNEKGLRGVANPSELFLSERPKGAPGSAVVPTLEGSRVLLTEIQALTAHQAFSQSQRTTYGVERSRVQILLALLERRLGFSMSSHDVFVSVAGGLNVAEPAGDLGLVCAISSAYLDRPLGERTVYFGEVGLAGEVRAVSRAEDRILEAHKLGFTRAVIAASQAKNIVPPKGFEIIGIDKLDRLTDIFD